MKNMNNLSIYENTHKIEEKNYLAAKDINFMKIFISQIERPEILKINFQNRF